MRAPRVELSIYFIWLVVSTLLKHISQIGVLFPIYGKIKNVPNHKPVFYPIRLILNTPQKPWFIVGDEIT